MKRQTRNYITTLLAIVVLGGLVFFALRDVEKKEEQKSTEEEAKAVFPELKSEAILRVKAVLNQKAYTFALRDNADAKWRIEEPEKTRANQQEYDGMVAFFKELKSKRAVTVSVSDLPKFKLDNNFPQIELTLASGKVLSLMVGSEQGFDKTYFVRRTDKTAGDTAEVFVVPSTVFERCGKTFDELRQKNLADRTKLDDTKNIEVKVKDFQFAFATDSETKEWKIAKPISAKADKSTLNKLESAFNEMKAEEFMPTEERSNLAKFGLDKPILTVKFTSNSGSEQTIYVSEVKEEAKPQQKKDSEKEEKDKSPAVSYYGKAEGYPEVAKLKKDEVERILKWVLFDYRDKNIFNFEKNEVASIKANYENEEVEAKRDMSAPKPEETWELQKPPYGKGKSYKFNAWLYGLTNLKTKQFIDETPKNLAEYGLEKPKGELVVKNKDGKELGHLLIGAKSQDGYFVMEKSVGMVQKIEISDLDSKLMLKPKDLAENPPADNENLAPPPINELAPTEEAPPKN